MSSPKEYLSHGEEQINSDSPSQKDSCVVDAPGKKDLKDPGSTSSDKSNDNPKTNKFE